VIAIDGFPGSGKTTVANRMAKAMPAVHVEVDQFLERNRGGFLTFIDYSSLAEVVRRNSREEVILVEGVCVKAVLARIAIAEDLHVYVKRTGQHRIWYEGRTFVEFHSVEDALRYEESLGPVPGLTRDVLGYHYDYQPHKTADIVYERMER
jgi:cytidylate kinase